MPIRTLEHLKQSAPNDFLRDFIDTAYHWREQPVAAKRKLTGRIETTTEVEVAPEPSPPSVAAPVYWNGVLKRPKVLVDIGEQIGDIGSGALTRLSGSWSLIEYLTQDDGDTRYATMFHAPTHHYGGADPLEGQEIHGLRVVDRPTFASITATSCSGIGTRPVVALADGTFDDQDAETFRGTISAAAAVHDHTSITGSAAKLTTPRSIGMTGDGTWSVSFDGSTNVSGAMTLASIITASGPIGSATRTPVITHDAKGRLTAVTDALITPAWSNVTSKPTTFSGLGVTMVASDLPNHASRHHYGGADALDGQSISGIRTVDSPSFSGIIILSNGAVGGQVGDNDFWRIKGGSTGSNSGFMEIATADDGTEPIVFRQYTGVFSAIVRTLEILDSNGNSIFPGRIESNGLWSPSIRLTGSAPGMVRTDSSGYLYVGSMSASELPNHASRHEYGGADALSGQNISGLRTSDSPTFSSLQLSATGYIDFGSGAGAIGVNSASEVYIRDVGGTIRVTVSPANTTFSHQIVALSARVANLSTGFVKSDGSGNLTNGPIIATDLPNHASRHEYGGADSLAGQSIAGLRTVDSPEFLNLSLDGALRFTGYSITSYDGDAFYVETSDGWQLIKSTLSEGTIITTGMFPTGNGLECGKSGYRWNFRSNDLNHDCETITASNTTPGSSIQTIPSTGNYFKLTNGSGGSTRNYRVPNAPGSGIGKRLALFSGSSDPDGFTRIYPPSSGQLWNGGLVVTTYVEFNSSAGALKIVMDSDGSDWHI